ncbi:uncharacterized protein LOC107054697 isoform X1 [Gallus gallus]|uniref:uncharacterized protein LOC107054697 isoform X1 n=1 Tax=Gallus gallus TaxID=9031 RepID=UPI001F00FA81|nr:uncharacterized protein LOC107054697 isoform X1 [Gallus gallus]
MDSQRGAKDANLSLRCIKDKLLPIAGTVLVAALLITVIALAAQKRPPCPPCPTAAPHLPGCPNDGIGVGLQCFYFVEDAADWDGGQRFCLSRGAQLAAVGTPQELVRWGGGGRWGGPGGPSCPTAVLFHRGSCCAMGAPCSTGLGCAGIARGRGCGPMGLSSITRSALRAAGAAPTRTAEGSAALSAPAPNVPSAAAPNGGGRSSEPTPGRRRGGLGGSHHKREERRSPPRLSVPTCPPPRPPHPGISVSALQKQEWV